MEANDRQHAPGAGCQHGHDHRLPADCSRAFVVGIVLNLAFVAVGAAYGFTANPMASLAHAARLR